MHTRFPIHDHVHDHIHANPHLAHTQSCYIIHWHKLGAIDVIVLACQGGMHERGDQEPEHGLNDIVKEGTC